METLARAPPAQKEEKQTTHRAQSRNQKIRGHSLLSCRDAGKNPASCQCGTNSTISCPAQKADGILDALRAVIQLLTEAANSGRKVNAFGLSAHFTKVFTLVGITKYAGLFPTQKEALAAF